MSREGSAKGSNNSQSESSSSSPNQTPFCQNDSNDITDLTLFGSAAPTFTRTGTVRRASAPFRTKEKDASGQESDERSEKKSDQIAYSLLDRHRQSLDSTYRNSLESVADSKTKTSFSSVSLFTSRDTSRSIDSSSSDCTDYAVRSCTESSFKEDKTTFNMSPGSSYLSWIESVNSEYFGSAVSSQNDIPDVDNKVGEWNNFWLNYNCARSKYLSSPYLNASVTDDLKTADELSEDVKSTCSTHREFITDRNSPEFVALTIDEINEAVKCSQRVVEILQNALKRNDNDFENSNNESLYSHQSFAQVPVVNVLKDERVILRERSFSYAVDSQELQKQKQLLKPTPQSSSTSCINAILNTGVGDILKRVISKRRDVLTSEDLPSISRSSFSEWSSAK